MDFSVNALTLLFQLFVTSRIVKKFGIAWTLALIPLLVIFGFISLSLASVIATIVIIQVVRRAGNYAIMRPSREMLYVILPREEKYKAKNFIDTSVYRIGDAASAWVFAGLGAVGFSLSGIAVIGVFISAVWAFISYRLGIMHDEIKSKL